MIQKGHHSLIFAGTLAIAMLAAGLTILSQDRRDVERLKKIGRLEGERDAVRRELVLAHAEVTRLTDSLDKSSAGVDSSVVRWKVRTVTDTLYLAADATAHDTITALQGKVEDLKKAGADVVNSCRELQKDCGEFRIAAAREIAAARRDAFVSDSLRRIGKPPKRWSVAAFGGYGATLSGGKVIAGPTFAVGVARSIWSW